MLMLQRRSGERIRLRDRETGREVWITMVNTTGQGRAKFGIEAPSQVEILREEMIGVMTEEPAGEGSRGAAP